MLIAVFAVIEKNQGTTRFFLVGERLPSCGLSQDGMLFSTKKEQTLSYIQQPGWTLRRSVWCQMLTSKGAILYGSILETFSKWP